MPPHTTHGPRAPEGGEPSAPPWDGAARFRLSGEPSRRAQPVPPLQQKGMRDREACRTAQRGGHAAHCPPGGFERYASNSCRHRPCPQGQTFPQVQWGEDRTAAWLPGPYCPRVFPGPHTLTPLSFAHTRPLVTRLCNAASQPLGQCGHRHLGGQSGGTLVRHPWAQTLGAPCHVHGVSAAGARSATGARGLDAEPRFLCPGRALSPVLRGQCGEALAQAGSTGVLPLAAGRTALGPPASFKQLRAPLSAQAWVVYAKAPVARPAHVLDSGGRSTPRVALAHHRLLDGRDGWVRFADRTRRQDNRLHTLTRDAHACLRRFLWHGLPSGCQRLRPSGFLATRPKARTLRRCRALRGQPSAVPPRRPKSAGQGRQEVTGIARTPCPHGGSKPRVRLPRPPLPPPAASRGAPVEVPICDAACALWVCQGCRRRYRNGSPEALWGTWVSARV